MLRGIVEVILLHHAVEDGVVGVAACVERRLGWLDVGITGQPREGRVVGEPVGRGPRLQFVDGVHRRGGAESLEVQVELVGPVLGA